jgi:hypothetical protein
MGATLRALNLTDTIAGGRLQLDGDTAGSRSPPPLRMAIKIKDFVMRDAPILARILAAASLPGLMNVLNHDGLKMTHLAAAASIQDGTLVLEKLRAHGGSLGITAQGEIDSESSKTELQGTVVPAYGLNSLLSHVPGLNLLVGGRGQGLIAVNYHVTGRLSDPQVFVNPISLLTPGVLRKLFDFVDETDQRSAAPPNEAGTSESGDP